MFLRADAVGVTKYVWRGITRSQSPTLQAHGALAIRSGAFRVATGAFASLEPFRADPGDRTLVGLGSRGLGEADFWGEASVAVGPTEVAAGLLRYTFHGDPQLGGLGSTANTTELFVRLDARGVSFAPAVTAWVDLEDVRGTYLELRSSAPVIAVPYRPYFFLALDAELGLSLGQNRNPTTGQRAHFHGNGPTHVQLGLTALQDIATWMQVSVGLRGQLGFDDSVRAGADGDRHRLKGWITLGAVVRPIRLGSQ